MLDDVDELGNILNREHRALPPHTAPGLRSPGLLGRWPLIGLLLVLFGLSAFGVFAFNVQTNGPLIHNDVVVAKDLHRAALDSPSWLRSLMMGGYFAGQHVIVAIGALLVSPPTLTGPGRFSTYPCGIT